MADRIYGNWQTAGVKIPTDGKSNVSNDGTDAYAQAVVVLDGSGEVVSGPATGMEPGQVSVAATATLIADAQPARTAIIIENHGTTAVYLGPSGVTTGTGLRLPGVDGASVTLEMTGPVYGITATGSQTVSFAELVR